MQGLRRSPPNLQSGGGNEAERPQVVASELFICTLTCCSCFTLSMIKVNIREIKYTRNYAYELLSFEAIGLT